MPDISNMDCALYVQSSFVHPLDQESGGYSSNIVLQTGRNNCINQFNYWQQQSRGRYTFQIFCCGFVSRNIVLVQCTVYTALQPKSFVCSLTIKFPHSCKITQLSYLPMPHTHHCCMNPQKARVKIAFFDPDIEALFVGELCYAANW